MDPQAVFTKAKDNVIGNLVFYGGLILLSQYLSNTVSLRIISWILALFVSLKLLTGIITTMDTLFKSIKLLPSMIKESRSGSEPKKNLVLLWSGILIFIVEYALFSLGIYWLYPYLV